MKVPGCRSSLSVHAHPVRAWRHVDSWMITGAPESGHHLAWNSCQIFGCRAPDKCCLCLLSQGHYYLGFALRETGDLPEAIQHLTKVSGSALRKRDHAQRVAFPHSHMLRSQVSCVLSPCGRLWSLRAAAGTASKTRSGARWVSASEAASRLVTVTVTCGSARRTRGAVSNSACYLSASTAHSFAARGPTASRGTNLNYCAVTASSAFTWSRARLLTAQLAGAKYRAWEDESAQRTAERRALRRRLDAALEALQLSEREDCQVPLGC